MTDLHTPTPARARTRISVLPAELQPGDQIRDCGMLRVVAANPGRPGPVDIVDVPLTPEGDYPPVLGVPAHQRVTAWRQP